MAGELGKAEVDEAVEPAHAVVEILPDAVALVDEPTQCFGSVVLQPGRGGALLESQARQALRVDGVGLGTLQAGVLETACHE